MVPLRSLVIDLGVMTAVGLVLALLGPFGTFAAPFGMRLLYWLALGYAGFALFMPAMILASRTAVRLALPEPALWTAACALASVPMTAVAWCANFVWQPVRVPTLEAAIALYGDVAVVGAIASLAIWFVGTGRQAGAALRPESAPEPSAHPKPPASREPEPPVPRLADRLPPHLRGTVLALEMEDHYVRVYTAAGSHLLLLRMRDAVAELGLAEGAQVHRSWWVARDAVAGTARDGRNVALRLVNGVEAPIARAMLPELRASGWLERGR